MIESWNIVSRKSLLKQQNSALILHWAPGFSNVFQSFQPSVRTESAVGIEEGKWKLGLFTGSCALICLQNCQTPSAPRSSSDQKVKTKSHLFPSRDLVSRSFGYCPLWSEATKFWFLFLECSLQVSGYWGARDWHRMSVWEFVWYQDLYFHLCSFIKWGITSARPKLGCVWLQPHAGFYAVTSKQQLLLPKVPLSWICTSVLTQVGLQQHFQCWDSPWRAQAL